MSGAASLDRTRQNSGSDTAGRRGIREGGGIVRGMEGWGRGEEEERKGTGLGRREGKGWRERRRGLGEARVLVSLWFLV